MTSTLTIKTIGRYTITTDGLAIYCNGRQVTAGAAPAGARSAAGVPLVQLVRTGEIGAGGRMDLVGLTAPEYQVYLDAVDARRAAVGLPSEAEMAAWSESAAGKAEAARVTAERAFDRGMNEGGEGYNPHRHGSAPTYR